MNEMLFPSHGLPLNNKCKVLALHKKLEILALEKAIGVQSHPSSTSHKREGRTLLHAEYHHEDEKYVWEEKGEKKQLFLAHRLDSATSGVLLATTDPEWAIRLKRLFQKRKIQKTYHAIVKMSSRTRFGIWEDRLVKEKKNGSIRVRKSDKGEVSLTHAALERHSKQSSFPLAMLTLRPKTGRTHQLRVQCAIRGLPILGDRTYGDFSFNRNLSRRTKIDRLFLHATALKIDMQNDGEENLAWEIESAIPRDFIRILA